MSDAATPPSDSKTDDAAKQRELARTLALTDARLARDSRRRKIAIGVLFVFIAVGFFLFKAPTETETRVVFVLPPSVVIHGDRVERDKFVELSAEILDAEGRALSQTHQAFPGGAVHPMTQPVRLTLPEGRYQVLAKVRGPTGKWGACSGVLNAVDDVTDARVRLK